MKEYSKKQKTVGLIIGGLVFLIGIPIILVTVSLLIDERLHLSYLIPNPLNFVVAIIFIPPGFLFVIWSGFTQLMVGKGTPVPAIPAQRLVTTGPYRFCRNPMLLGTVIYYLGISFWINSISAVMITVLFLMCSVMYIKFVEEKKLELSFGEEYKEYKKKTPFLIPHLKSKEI